MMLYGGYGGILGVHSVHRQGIGGDTNFVDSPFATMPCYGRIASIYGGIMEAFGVLKTVTNHYYTTKHRNTKQDYGGYGRYIFHITLYYVHTNIIGMRFYAMHSPYGGSMFHILHTGAGGAS